MRSWASRIFFGRLATNLIPVLTQPPALVGRPGSEAFAQFLTPFRRQRLEALPAFAQPLLPICRQGLETLALALQLRALIGCHVAETRQALTRRRAFVG